MLWTNAAFVSVAGCAEVSIDGARGRRARKRASFFLSAALMVCAAPGAAVQDEPTSGQKPVSAMSPEELLNVEVTSVSRKSELRVEAAAAVYVLTAEDIRRSGATTLVEALRLVPGVQVSRINANQWAVGIRGFANRLSRAVLVLIDGRSVYTPLSAGVFWEAQDTLLEDVDRIEVIRGPGGTLWGANAVNGVINIITRPASETQGGLVSAGGGTEERALVAGRYGGAFGPATSYRVYGKYADRDAQFHRDGIDFDDWRMGQVGFRTDTLLASADRLTIQGDGYVSENGQRAVLSSYTPPFVSTVYRDARFSGANLLGRWTHTPRSGSEVRLRAYYDYTHHREALFQEDRHTFDLDFLHHFSASPRHDITWGLAFRSTSDDTEGGELFVMSPPSRTDRLYSGFVQDEVSLAGDRLRITVGTKLEHNDYTDFELQPTGRLVFLPHAGHVLWAAVSRAVRTPSRIEADLSLTFAASLTSPVFARFVGDDSFESEELIAYEAGYRLQATRRVFLDLAGFYNDYENLLSLEVGTPFSEPGRLIIPVFFRNQISGRGRGFEIAADAVIAEWLRLRGSYSYLSLDVDPDPGSMDTGTVATVEGSSPRRQAVLGASLNLPGDLELDAVARYVDRIPAQGTDRYLTADLRLAWRPSARLELSVVGQNLSDPAHPEFGATEIERAVYGKLSWRF